MPTYQYACKACDHRFEAVQPFADAALSDCPECAGTLRKVFSSVGIVFKGSGFYRTDSRAGAVVNGGKDGSDAKASGSEKSSSSSNGSSSGSKSGSSSESSGSKSGASASSTPAAAAS